MKLYLNLCWCLKGFERSCLQNNVPFVFLKNGISDQITLKCVYISSCLGLWHLYISNYNFGAWSHVTRLIKGSGIKGFIVSARQSGLQPTAGLGTLWIKYIYIHSLYISYIIIYTVILYLIHIIYYLYIIILYIFPEALWYLYSSWYIPFSWHLKLKEA